MIEGLFNTDTPALARRIQAHEQFGARDLNAWVFEHADLREGMHLLDLGCGTGKQAIPAAQRVGATGRVTAVDLSTEALAAVRASAEAAGVADRVETVHSDLDQVHERLGDRRFDRALSCYALYYTQAPRPLFEGVAARMNEGGVFFFCGPSGANNRELKEFHNRLLGRDDAPATAAAEFMEQTGPAFCRELFGSVEMVTFENPLRFDSAEALYTYWTSYNLYDPALDDAFRRAADEYFAGSSVFETVKRVVGVRAVK